MYSILYSTHLISIYNNNNNITCLSRITVPVDEKGEEGKVADKLQFDVMEAGI